MMNRHEKRKKTLLARYGVTCGYLTEKTRAAALAGTVNAANIRLSNGEMLSAFCDRNGINRYLGRKIFKKYGEDHLLKYINIGKKITSTEIKFIEIMKEINNLELLDKNPAGLEGCRKADFAIEVNNKRLYVVTENLWDSNSDRLYYNRLYDTFAKNSKDIKMFYSNEIFDKPKVVKSLIKAHFKTNTKISARECEIRKVTVQAGEWFFKEHSLAPYCPKYLTYYAFLLGEKMVACAGVRMRAGRIANIDLFEYSSGHYVTDAVKMLSFFIQKRYNPLKIFTIRNLRYENVDDFVKEGFEIQGVRVGGEWTDGDAVYESFEDGLFKVFDMGRITMIKKLSNSEEKS